MKTTTKALQVLEKLSIPSGVDPKEAEAQKGKVLKLYDIAEAVEIKDVRTLQEVEGLSKSITEYKRNVKKAFEAIVEKLKTAKKAATEAFSEMNAFIDNLIGPADDAQRIIDAKSREYRAAEQRRIDDENTRKRREAEEKAKADRDAEIAKLKADGSKEAKDIARALKDEPLDIGPIAEEKLPETKGIVHREAWTCEPSTQDDALALALLVEAAMKQPSKYIRFLQPDMIALNAEARTMKSAFSVPGFKAVDRGATAHR